MQETAATNSPGSRLEEVETETAAEHGERVEGRRQMLRNCAFLVGIIASQVVRTSTLVHIERLARPVFLVEIEAIAIAPD